MTRKIWRAVADEIYIARFSHSVDFSQFVKHFFITRRNLRVKPRLILANSFGARAAAKERQRTSAPIVGVAEGRRTPMHGAIIGRSLMEAFIYYVNHLTPYSAPPLYRNQL